MSPTCVSLQGWVYNVIPWLSAIPLAVGGGYVSDFLVNKGTAARRWPLTLEQVSVQVKREELILSPCLFRSQCVICEEAHAGMC